MEVLMSDGIDLNMVECKACGESYWVNLDITGVIAGGPCCKDIPVLDIERFPTERAAVRAYPAWAAADLAAMLKAKAAAEANELRYAA